MKFVLKPSLEHMALVKIAISLWNQNDIRALISKLYESPPCDMDLSVHAKIEKRVMDKVPQLSLSQILKEKLFGVIMAIGIQISDWMIFHCTHSRFYVNIPVKFCWTPQGTVDRKKTAEMLVKYENLDMSTCYQLACIYCLEDDIHKLWNIMPENIKQDIKESYLCKWPTVRFWSHNLMRGELENSDEVSDDDYEDEFRSCMLCHNIVGAEYFLQKLTPKERKESLVEVAKYVIRADFLCFFLSKMDEEQQMEIYKNNPYEVLYSFLQWPFQSFFIEIANCMWDFLTKSDYDSILRGIIIKMSKDYKDWNYQKLFREFWQESPSALKSLITNEIDKSWLLPSLFRIKDKENIRLVLKDTNFTAKEKLIYSNVISDFCTWSIHDNEWDFLQFVMLECSPSKTTMLKFKEEFEREFEMYMLPYLKEHFATKKHKWDEIFHLSDDSIFQYNKRNLERGESSSSKRFHSLQ